jgi:hypothetical protein
MGGKALNVCKISFFKASLLGRPLSGDADSDEGLSCSESDGRWPSIAVLQAGHEKGISSPGGGFSSSMLYFLWQFGHSTFIFYPFLAIMWHNQHLSRELWVFNFALVLNPER